MHNEQIEFHTFINSVTEVVYVVSMHCGLPGLGFTKEDFHTRGTECACAQ